ncbi:MAG: ferredoxin [Candidatus Heimdallarchaeota archaeon]|nr:ferredoxin [Candidatus Heimdallarchaeota archaeon]
MVKIPRVNRFECCGCSLCTLALPEVFRMSPEGVSEAYNFQNIKPKEIEKVMNDCPVNCIHWYEQNGNN